MIIPKDVLQLIQDEQNEQNGGFIPSEPSFLKKLQLNAELITHTTPDGLAGYIFFYCNHPDKLFSYITLLGIDKKFRKKGIGSNLIQQVLYITEKRGYHECRLEVLKTNELAISFYQKLGFKIKEDRKTKLLLFTKIK